MSHYATRLAKAVTRIMNAEQAAKARVQAKEVAKTKSSSASAVATSSAPMSKSVPPMGLSGQASSQPITAPSRHAPSEAQLAYQRVVCLVSFYLRVYILF